MLDFARIFWITSAIVIGLCVAYMLVIAALFNREVKKIDAKCRALMEEMKAGGPPDRS